MAYFLNTDQTQAQPNVPLATPAPTPAPTAYTFFAGPTAKAVVGPLTPVAVPNVPPQNIAFKQTIILGTTDSNNNNIAIQEGYVVSGPTSPGMSPIVIAGGAKVVIPLTTGTGPGAPFLKIHYPTNPLGNALYVTYCVANNSMADGYYDYTTGVPSAYFSALRTWINTNVTNGQQLQNANGFTLRERILYLSAFGNLTNKPANSISFQIKFQGTFGPVPNVNKIIAVTTTLVATAVAKTQ